GNEGGTGIAVDGVGNVYVTGATGSTNFPTANPLQGSLGGGVDVFVAKFDPFGARLYSTYLGRAGDEEGHAIAVDFDRNGYLTGTTTSTNFPTVNPFQATNRGLADAFVAKAFEPLF